ncbi:hypothetical protein ACCS75_04005 [Rhizobium ruizarguesonis]
MTNAANSMPEGNGTSRPDANSMSVGDMAMVVDMLLSIRVTAHTTSCLANHMGREGVEDIADDVTDAIDGRLDVMVAALCAVAASAEAQALLARISSVLCLDGAAND